MGFPSTSCNCHLSGLPSVELEAAAHLVGQIEAVRELRRPELSWIRFAARRGSVTH